MTILYKKISLRDLSYLATILKENNLISKENNLISKEKSLKHVLMIHHHYWEQCFKNNETHLPDYPNWPSQSLEELKSKDYFFAKKYSELLLSKLQLSTFEKLSNTSSAKKTDIKTKEQVVDKSTSDTTTYPDKLILKKAKVLYQNLLERPYLFKEMEDVVDEEDKIIDHIYTVLAITFKEKSFQSTINNYEEMTHSPGLQISLSDAINSNIPIINKIIYSINDQAPPTIEGVIKAITFKDKQYRIEIEKDKESSYLIFHNNKIIKNDAIDDSNFNVGIYHHRSDKLWKWCFELTKITAMPYVKELDGVSLDDLSILKLKAIMVNVLIDDLADHLQQHELVSILCEFITATLQIRFIDKNDFLAQLVQLKKSYSNEDSMLSWSKEVATKKKLSDIQNSSYLGQEVNFSNYYSLCLSCWCDFMKDLCNRYHDSKFQLLLYLMKTDYEKIIHQFKEAKTMDREIYSAYEDKKFDKLVKIEKLLAFNMNMFPFELIDRFEFYKRNDRFYFKNSESIFFRSNILELGQFCGQTANHIATLKREIMNKEFANPLLWILPMLSDHMERDLLILQSVNSIEQKTVIDRVISFIDKNYIELLAMARFETIYKQIESVKSDEKIPKKITDQVDDYKKSILLLGISYITFKSHL